MSHLPWVFSCVEQSLFLFNLLWTVAEEDSKPPANGESCDNEEGEDEADYGFTEIGEEKGAWTNELFCRHMFKDAKPETMENDVDRVRLLIYEEYKVVSSLQAS